MQETLDKANRRDNRNQSDQDRMMEAKDDTVEPDQKGTNRNSQAKQPIKNDTDNPKASKQRQRVETALRVLHSRFSFFVMTIVIGFVLDNCLFKN